MIAIVAMVELGIHRSNFAFTSIAAANYRFADRNWREAAGLDIVCLGDSQLKDGLIPDTITTRTGQTSFNLAIGGSTPHSAYFLLKRMIDAGRPPRTLLLGFKPFNLGNDPLFDARSYAELMTFEESRELTRAAHHPEYFLGSCLYAWIPSIRAQFEIRTSIIRLGMGVTNPNFYRFMIHWRNWKRNRGSQINPVNVWMAEQPTPVDASNYLNPVWECHPTNRIFIDRTIALAQSSGIRVIWVQSPIHPAVQRLRDAAQLDRPVDRMLQEILDSHPGLNLLDGRRSGYPGVRFVDSCHLDSEGAQRFSQDVADFLQTNPRRDWCQLPRSGTGDRWSKLEDLNDSSQALSRPAGTLRR